MKKGQLMGSYKDPSGFIYTDTKKIYRQITTVYQKQYDQLLDSGLYKALVQENFLIPHHELSHPKNQREVYKVIQPQKIQFISYPYEWTFSQLQKAALLTLRIQKKSLAYNMILKDASAYNVQFLGTQPIFIDTLSFDKYEDGIPWVAYRQFCEHFLAPLALAAYVDVELIATLRNNLDGIPLSQALYLLPLAARFNPGLLTHIFLHAKLRPISAKKFQPKLRGRVSKNALLGLIESLESTVTHLPLPKATAFHWQDYYTENSYSAKAFSSKQKIVTQMISQQKYQMAWDLGSNTGLFSQLLSRRSTLTISFDIDYDSLEKQIKSLTKNDSTRILSLRMDFANPSPALGWNTRERFSLQERGPADIVLALALTHHFAIVQNIPFDLQAIFFAGIARELIIEFIPKSDSQIEKMLEFREDIFFSYTKETFEKSFTKYFHLKTSQVIRESNRIIYNFVNKQKK